MDTTPNVCPVYVCSDVKFSRELPSPVQVFTDSSRDPVTKLASFSPANAHTHTSASCARGL